jgi:hypothetical protein
MGWRDQPTRESTVSARGVIILLGRPAASNVKGEGRCPGWAANHRAVLESGSG